MRLLSYLINFFGEENLPFDINAISHSKKTALYIVNDVYSNHQHDAFLQRAAVEM
ncbi:MAG: hypothetical protein K0S27_400 [Gammaproteobacteria bacterium]|jgi:hypothetical protein|nr:hypothetical protein [Gammaproteobacteria bacterium]